MTSPTDAANLAVERLRAVREKAAERRAAGRKAVDELRERNREESRQLAEQAKARQAGRNQQQPGWPDRRQPQTMSLYDNDGDDEPPYRPPVAGRPPHVPQQPPTPARPPQPRQQPRRDDDDWTQESWLH